MTEFRKIHDGDDPTQKTLEQSRSTQVHNQSLRERALATYRQRVSANTGELQFTIEETQRALHELQVHQIELEMQNEELRQSQLALEESRQRYRDLYDRAPAGYCLVSHAGLVQEANRTLAEMLGLAATFLNEERLSRFIAKIDQDVFYFMRKRLVTSAEPQACELRLLTAEGKEFWAQLSVSLAPEDAAVSSLRVIVVDIDARIRAEAEKAALEAQLRESQKMEAMGTLAGGIAHDFNNILAVILSNVELANNFATQPESPMVHCVEEIQKAGERARDLVKQLLAFCRRQPTERKSISLAPVVEDCIRMLRSTIPVRVSLSFSSAENVPNILADATQIEQVIINLATNAAQAMNGNAGAIKIHVDTVERPVSTWDNSQSQQATSSQWQLHHKMVRLVFADDGPGMSESVIERIFEPFFTTKSVDEGTGLGLAVVHGIIRAHDGDITVESHVGQGTTFTILLPPNSLAEMDSAVEQVIETTDLERRSTTTTLVPPVDPVCRILYIDDDEMVLQSLVNLLGHVGMQVRGYSDQLTALAALRSASNKFDLVVTDYNMPGLSGLDVARLVREIRADLPVIVTSGFIDEELHGQADEAGVKALIPKPFSAKFFCDLATKLLHVPPK